MDEIMAREEAILAALEIKKEKLEYEISDFDVNNSLSASFPSVNYIEAIRTVIISGSTALLVGAGSYVLTENVGVTALLSLATLGGVMAFPKLYEQGKANQYNSRLDELDEKIAYQKQFINSMKR